MIEFLILSTLIVAIALLITLAIIDFKKFLLPNIFVFPFGILGIIFHILNDFALLTPNQLIIGAAFGYAILYAIRWGGNKYYKQDSLGLGDVKLLAASGLWLGIEGVLIAMTLGAMVGLIHGLFYAAFIAIRHKKPFSISRLVIPAGPGFIVGIIAAFTWLFFHDVLSIFYEAFLKACFSQ